MSAAARARTVAYTRPDAMASSRRWLFGSMVALMALGLVMVYSADILEHMHRGDDLVFLQRQLVRFAVGVGGFLLAARIGPHLLFALARPLWLMGVLLLGLVLAVGPEINQAQRWLVFGPIVFQPSEFARVATIILIAAWMAAAGERARTFKDGIAVPLAIAGVPAALVLVEPDFGSSVYLLFMAVLVLWVGGARSLHLLAGFLICLVAGSAYAVTRLAHVTRRIDLWLNPEPTDQVSQGLTALASGGTLGSGLGASVGKWGFVPEAESDFVLAIIGEELGLVGILVVLLLYGLFLWHGVRLIMGLRSRFALVVGAGLIMQVVVQALANVAVVAGTVPPKGIPLPFVSAGGSSRLVLCISAGLLLGLSRRPEEDPVGDSAMAGGPRPAAPGETGASEAGGVA